MGTDEFFYLGRILKPHGTQGEVLVFLDTDDPERYVNLESVYLDLHGERIPFFIESIRLKHQGKAVVRFQDFASADDAESLKGLSMFLPATLLPRLKGKRFYFHEVKGFAVTDKNHGPIGFVEDVLDLPLQPLLRVRHGSREILIPAVDEIILKVDRRKKLLEIEAPAGLIEIYL